MNLTVFDSAAVSFLQQILLAAGTLGMGMAAAGTAWFFVSLLCRPLPCQADSWEFEKARRMRLRAGCLTYRCFEPLIEELKPLRLLHRLGRKDRVEKDLGVGADPLPWTAEEFLAAKVVEGLIAAVATGIFGLQWLGAKAALALAAATPALLVWRRVRRLSRKAQLRIRQLKQRLPFGIDLIALMMEAGAGIRESLASVACETRGHPLGDEFHKVLQGMSRGQTLRQSLQDLQQRLDDPEISEVVYAAIKAEELGTPLGKIFLALADQMRLRRSQWAEKTAGEAQAKITFPGVVIMVACMLLVVAPFLLYAVAEWPF